ncbi:MAG TPA: hypothetical protein VFU57_01995 [Candidatus Acidoferrales bacterium]|nr:hypothetical protein [Candidatus Acidoferrales bacterium]
MCGRFGDTVVYACTSVGVVQPQGSGLVYKTAKFRPFGVARSDPTLARIQKPILGLKAFGLRALQGNVNNVKEFGISAVAVTPLA